MDPPQPPEQSAAVAKTARKIVHAPIAVQRVICPHERSKIV